MAGDVAAIIADLVGRMAELERKLANLMRPGEIAEVDHDKGLARFKSGEMTSNWLPWMEQAGAVKSWTPPSVGQQVHLFSPSGEPGQGWIMPAGFSDANKAPHNKAGEQMLSAAKIILKGDVEIFGKLTIEGASVTHNSKNIGNTHKHGGVEPGGGTSDVPI